MTWCRGINLCNIFGRIQASHVLIRSSVNCPTVICLPIVCYFSWEKPLVRPKAPGLLSHIFALRSTFPLRFYSDLLNQKNTKISCCTLFHLWSIISIQYNFLPSVCLSWGAVPRKGLTTPLTRRVARCCYLCAGAVYVVFVGVPGTGVPRLACLRPAAWL